MKIQSQKHIEFENQIYEERCHRKKKEHGEEMEK
jgi:hypothetical protein